MIRPSTVAAGAPWELLDDAPAGMMLFGSGGVCRYANRAAHRMLGYPEDGLVGVSLDALLPAVAEVPAATASRRLRAGVTGLGVSLRRADGSMLEGQVSSTPFPDRSLMLVMQDVGPLLRTLDSLRGNESRYRSLVEVTSDWLWEADPAGVYTYASPRCRELMGYQPEELVGRSAFDFIAPEEREAMTAYFHDISARKVPFVTESYTTIRKDGRRIVIETSGVPVLDTRGEVICYRGIDRDVTERKCLEAALEKSRGALAEAQRIARIGNWEWDIAGNRFEWSDELYRIFGVEPAAFAGTLEALIDRVHPRDRAAVRNAVGTILQNRKPLLIEYRIIRPGGEERIIEARAELACAADGAPLRLLGTAQDVTEKRSTEAGLQRMTQALENTCEGVLIIDANRQVLAINKAYTTMTGYGPAEMIGKDPFRFRTLHEGQRSWQAIWESANEDGLWEGEVQGERKNGEFYNERLAISVLRDHGGNIVNYIAVISDISKLRQSEDQLNYLSSHDTLTGLPNRQHLFDRLRQLILWSGKDAGGFALVQIDIDGFQAINNTLGHLTGNQALQIAAERLQSSIRRRDLIARIGADEFALIFDGISTEEEAAPLIRKLHNSLGVPVTLGSDEIELGACIGAVFFPADGKDPETLLQHADTALHRAKRQGRGVCRYYTPDMTANVSERFSLERALRRAVRSGEGISLNFQPQIDALSGQCVGVEALMRWKHPQLGEIPPSRFIPVAEESSLIVSLGEWVLDKACAELRATLDAGLPAVRMAINVSGRQFSDARLITEIGQTLQRYRLPAELLEVEITESSLMEDTMRAHSVLRQLKALGVFIAIDDFGTGYSSLNYLKSFPLDILKIDKSFIDGIPGDEHDEAIARAVIAMAHGLRIRVTAEGVETVEQRRFLQMHGCDFLQGYLISQPVPAEAFRHWLIENTRTQ